MDEPPRDHRGPAAPPPKAVRGGGSWRRGWLATLAVALISSLAALALGELAVRRLDLFAPQRAHIDSDPAAGLDRGGDMVPHPFVGWARAPGRSFPDIHRRTNDLGLLSQGEDYRDVPAEDFAVGVFGGSVAGALAVEGAAALRTELVRRRPELAGRVRVLSMANGGYKQPQPLMLLAEMLVLGVPLDAVVNLDGFNEVALGAEDVAAGYHPLFPSRLLEGPMTAFAGASATEEDLASALAIRRLRRWSEAVRRFVASGPLRRSELARALGGLASRRLAWWAYRAEEELQQRTAAAGSDLAALPPRCEAGPQCYELIADLWARSSLAMEALSRSRGALYLHLLQPNQHLPGTKPLSAEERQLFLDPENPWSRAAVEGYPFLQRHGERLRQAGVAFYDLTAIFHDHPETLYRDRCCHLNARGNELLGREVGRLLAAALSGGAPAGR